MIRVCIFRDKTEKDGIVLCLEDSMDSFKLQISSQFDLSEKSFKLFLLNGCEVTDLRSLRDEDKIYLSLDCNEASIKCDELEVSQQSCSTRDRTVSDWIRLNVGGKLFMTSRSTLLVKEPLSMLARMFADDNNVYLMNPSAKDETGAYLIDRSPEYFEPILNYLRHGQVILDKNINPQGVLEEAIFYGIDSMIPQLNQLVEQSKSRHDNNQSLTRMDVYACLSRCNLSGANLSHCCLERADLSHANLEGAHLLGVKALCANMEGAILKGCNMEDPAGSRAVMEGVNLKGANLEGSNMAGVNLRVATLKNANLQNCDLRAAVLAGADLECCDLSGSDLHEANLRGANLKDAAFELMLTPLHMSQTIR
ncbi:BTB/POZ domain-containing protein KCTD9 isoform X2 [Zerene cesonia]|uniref:BTB/POZ domain-containing protein KCTD9 isoform X2 n=1 Tax=Zerene cesonia TaxID=33412 RepID=UPI0018E52173|nr:BTB/POZ domain-containing protein KCTD9 isoform X2 [Zerene cesonia]